MGGEKVELISAGSYLRGFEDGINFCRKTHICLMCKRTLPEKDGDEYDCEILMSTTRKDAMLLIANGFGCNRFEPKG